MQNLNRIKILYVGENFLGSTSLQRFAALQRLGHDLDEVNFSKTFNKNSFNGYGMNITPVIRFRNDSLVNFKCNALILKP